jgi:hypothetical protein
VDRHRFDADPDPNFHFDDNPVTDTYPDWHQNDADPHADPTPRFDMLEIFLLLLVTALPVHSVKSFSSVSKVS